MSRLFYCCHVNTKIIWREGDFHLELIKDSLELFRYSTLLNRTCLFFYNFLPSLARGSVWAVPRFFSALACVAWRFWLGALSNKGGREQRNREEIGAEATRALRARISLLRRSCAQLDKKPPCYAGYFGPTSPRFCKTIFQACSVNSFDLAARTLRPRKLSLIHCFPKFATF